MLAGLSALQRLNLATRPRAGFGATDIAPLALAPMLSMLSERLVHLDVSLHTVSSDAAERARQAASLRALAHLRVLRLCQPPDGGASDPAAVAAFTAAAAPGLPRLRQLDLRGVALADADSGTLVHGNRDSRAPAGVSTLTSLQLLIITDHRVGAAGCRALAAGLRCMPDLRYLDLSGSTNQTEGSQVPPEALGSAAAQCSRLRCLTLRRLGMCADGFAVLVDALTEAPLQHLLDLEAASNPLNAGIVSAVARALERMPALHTLSLPEQLPDAESGAVAQDLHRCCRRRRQRCRIWVLAVS
jgi:hypothetical protein